MLANFGPGIWSRVSGVGPGFYSFPLLSSVFYENQYLSAGKEDFSSRKNNIPCIFLLQMERNPTPAMNLRMIGKICKHDHGCTVQYIHVRPWHDDRLTQFASKTNLRSNQSNDLFSAFCLKSFLCYFLFCLYARCPFCLFV